MGTLLDVPMIILQTGLQNATENNIAYGTQTAIRKVANSPFEREPHVANFEIVHVCSRFVILVSSFHISRKFQS